MRWGLAVVGAGSVAACESFGTTNNDPSAVATNDAGPTPMAVADAGSDAGADGAVSMTGNLVPGGGFEGATGGECGRKDWTLEGRTYTGHAWFKLEQGGP